MQAGGNISRPFCNCWSRIFAQKTNSRRRADTYVCVGVCVEKESEECNMANREENLLPLLSVILSLVYYLQPRHT